MGFVSCTALWRNRVARFILKKRVLLLSKVFGLEMGTRFFFYTSLHFQNIKAQILQNTMAFSKFLLPISLQYLTL